MIPRSVACLHWKALPLVRTTHGAAAGDSWKVEAAGSRVTGAPGSTSLTSSTGIATFRKTLTAGRTVTVDENRNIGTITSNGPNGKSAAVPEPTAAVLTGSFGIPALRRRPG